MKRRETKWEEVEVKVKPEKFNLDLGKTGRVKAISMKGEPGAEKTYLWLADFAGLDTQQIRSIKIPKLDYGTDEPLEIEVTIGARKDEEGKIHLPLEGLSTKAVDKLALSKDEYDAIVGAHAFFTVNQRRLSDFPKASRLRGSKIYVWCLEDESLPPITGVVVESPRHMLSGKESRDISCFMLVARKV